MERIEPERELIRRVLPFGVPAVALAGLMGAGLGGWEVGLSAGLGAGIVLVNFAVHGWSLDRAARFSLTILYAVALTGVIVRLAAIIGIMVLLDQLAFFSRLVFLLAAMTGTVLLLAFEMRQLQGRMQAELWNLSRESARP